MSGGKQQSWHVDRGIPISVLFALLVQTAGVVWWASDQSSINRAQAQEIAELNTEADKVTGILEERNIRMTKLEFEMQEANKKLDTVLGILRNHGPIR